MTDFSDDTSKNGDKMSQCYFFQMISVSTY